MAESEQDAAAVVEDGDADPVRLCGVGRARSGRSAVRCPVVFTAPFYTVTVYAVTVHAVTVHAITACTVTGAPR